MKNTKRFAIIALVLIAVLAMTACDPAAGQPSQEPTSAQNETPQETATPAPSAESTSSDAPQPTESAEQSPQPSESAAEPAPVSVLMTGEIQEILDEADQIRVTGTGNMNTVDEVLANISDDTVILDADGNFVDDDMLKVGDAVQLTLSGVMTFSMPPMSNAYMVVVNPPQTGMGVPTYIIAGAVTEGDDGSAAILNQNGDTVVTIPADLTIEVREPDGEAVNRTVTPADLKTGDVLLAWYDFVAASFPGQATATRAMLIVDD